MKASDLFVRCLENGRCHPDLRGSRRGERRLHDLPRGLADRVRADAARAGRGVHGGGARAADGRARRLPRHARPRRHEPDHRGGRRQHGSRPAGRVSPARPTANASTRRATRHMDVVAMMRSGHELGPGRARAPRQHPRGGAQGLQAGDEAEKPGACHIELPEDVAKRWTWTPRRSRPHPCGAPVPDDKIVDRAFEVLRSAERPVILAGNGCDPEARQQAAAALRRGHRHRRDQHLHGQGLRRHGRSEYCLFTIGLQAKDLVACAIDAADVVVCLGYDMVEYHPTSGIPEATSASFTSTSCPPRSTSTTAWRSRWWATSPTRCGC